MKLQPILTRVAGPMLAPPVRVRHSTAAWQQPHGCRHRCSATAPARLDTQAPPAPALHVQTPLVHSNELTAALGTGAPVFLKLENVQPSGSFKLRGIGAACVAAVSAGASLLVSSSGGNAGLAVAYSARAVGVDCVVVRSALWLALHRCCTLTRTLVPQVVPRSTPEAVRARLAQYGASVVVHGEHWAQAHEHAQLLVDQAGGSAAALVHPFEGEATWGGHATLVAEIRDQLPGVAAAAGYRHILHTPGCIALSVGGGGLLMGVLRGCTAVGWTAADTVVLAVETRGADCLSQAVAARSPVTLPGITSIASSLGAPTASAAALQACLEPGSRVACATVEDAAAVDACLRLLKDHRMLVEPACGAALAPVYRSSGGGAAAMPSALEKAKSVVVVVCGGANVQHDALLKWQAGFAATSRGG